MDEAAAETTQTESSPAPVRRAAPVLLAERISSLDFLRGIAVLGILLMNIQAFAMPAAAYMNPTAYGDLTGINYWVWWCTHVLGDQKFMTMFSILFGAGIVLMTSRAEARSGRSAVVHYRRMLWLLAIGLVHAYLIWYGDILVSYAICGMIVYPLRRLRAAILVPLGVVLIAVASVISIGSGLSMPYWPEENLEGFKLEVWHPPDSTIEREIAQTTGSWLEQLTLRAPASLMFQTVLMLIWTLWRAGGLMVMGMGLLKLGVLSAQRSRGFYAAMAMIGIGIGVPLEIVGVRMNESDHWDVRTCFFLNSQVHYWASLILSLGWMGLILLAYKSRAALFAAFAAAGRMALTNYLAQSVICSALFYGGGLEWFGELERVEQWGVVGSIWVVELIWSPLWLRRYRFGPAEWLWRSLTYWKRQPMRHDLSGSGGTARHTVPDL
jgi:uncharacterized protein